MGKDSSLFYAVNKTNINKNRLNLDIIDRGKSERSTGVFLLNLDENYDLHRCTER